MSSTLSSQNLSSSAKSTAVTVTLLAIVCLLWESIGAPVKPLTDGFPWLTLKAIPLLPLIPRLFRGERRAFQILSLLILLYSTEGWVRAFSDLSPTSRLFAWSEIALSLVIFVQAIRYARKTRPTAPLATLANTTPKERKPRPSGKSQLMMYLYATLLCLTGMSFMYAADGSESARFYQVMWLIRSTFVALNLWLLFNLIRQGRARARCAQIKCAQTESSSNNHESA